MGLYQRGGSAALGLAAIAVGGCADTPTQSPSFVSARTTELVADAPPSWTLDGLFYRVGLQIPTFAGAHVEKDSSLVVLLTDSRDSTSADRAVRAELGKEVAFSPKIAETAREHSSPLPKRTSYRRVAFTFRQLLAWKQRLYSDLISTDGTLSIDVDEVENRISVGVLDMRARELVSALAARFEVPQTAIFVHQEEPTKPAAYDIRSRQRPLTGGFELWPSGCTMNGAVLQYGNQMLLTASHCTSQKYQTDGGTISQGNAGDPFGFETLDPAKYGCGTFFSPKQCRKSDAAAYNVNYIPTYGVDTLSWSPGLIAKTLSPANGLWQTDGSLVVDSLSPYWYIQSTMNTVLVGYGLHKVGRSTGWTFGDVIHTCKDKKDTLNNVWIVCSDLVNLYSEGGDSGSPVFIAGWNLSATFVGLLWGKDPGSTVVISNFAQMKQDLGVFSFW